MGGRHKSWALVVEDEPWQAKALCRVLSRRFRVRLASTQREALAALGQTTPLRLVLTALSVGPGPVGRAAGSPCSTPPPTIIRTRRARRWPRASTQGWRVTCRAEARFS